MTIKFFFSPEDIKRLGGAITGKPEVWKNADGSFSHHKSSSVKWADETACRTDLRFCKEWAR